MSTCQPHRRAGIALLAVLWIGALAAILLVGVRVGSSVDLSLSHAELDRVQARWLARAGVDQAMAVLASDGRESDSPLDGWFSDPGMFENIELRTGSYAVTAPPADLEAPTTPRYGVTDLAGLVNLNAADSRQLQRLPDVPETLAASVLDWRDRNSNTRSGGAERAYYARLEFPYLPANKAFSTPRELRLVKDVTDELFYGEDADLDGVLDPNEDDGDASLPDDDANGELERGLGGLTTPYGYELNRTSEGLARLDITRATESQFRRQLNLTSALAKGIVTRRNSNRFDSLLDLLDARPDPETIVRPDEEESVQTLTLEWLAENLDELTISRDERLPAKVNINTAPRDVLVTLPQIDENAADRIIRHRASDAGPFSSVGELLTADILSDREFRAVAERVVVRSQVFQIDATGSTSRGIRERIIAVVDRGSEPMRVLYWHEGF